VGLRRDGGDAKTGAGMNVVVVGAFTDTVTGLSLDVRVRTLVVHQAEGLLAAEAQRRESPPAGEVSNGFLGRATFGW